ncbi:MAG: SUMF1/EgtB/PvdO family nonheme iron enzyme [Candidatus Marinimicrobia bacterium]|jgi:formylglycine-generating enzyme required for sulfatase activity|nr:SUMF1/EgtB/PvdO family nonheme iron enzyme [Candidatus Neomarinimicrobiota bacterium]|tara:strand:+ start:5751 stop:6704 length:954 start_codon:yes stop_codon:yes gene_type:complete
MFLGFALAFHAQIILVQDSHFNTYTEPLTGSKLFIKMVPVTGGTFNLGSPKKEKDRKNDEGPAHEVTVDDFWMAEVEISWDIYELFLNRKIDHTFGKRGQIDLDIDGVSGATPPYVNYNKNELPAINVTQYAASQFCKWFTAKTGRYYRLPTEAEWEYACRGGKTTAYSFGKNAKEIDQFGWYKGNSKGKLHKSRMKKPNKFGLYDMHGNAAEWVLDSYDPEAYITWEKGIKNPVKKNRVLYPRVVRGGSFKDDPAKLRSAARGYSTHVWKQRDPQIPKSLWWHTDATHIGFRIVRPRNEPDKNDLHKLWVQPKKEY